MIGSLGDVIFTVSSERVRTFRGGTRELAIRWARHPIASGGKKMEWIGHDGGPVNLVIRLDVDRATDPIEEVESLRADARAGVVHPLILGDRPMGDFVILSISEDWRRVSADGALESIDVSLTLEDYE